MPSTRRHSYDLNFKLKIAAEAEAVNNAVKLLANTAYWNRWSVNGETNSMSCSPASSK